MSEKVKYKGLSSEEVSESRVKYGVNVLTPPEKESLFMKFLGKFKDPLIIVLLIAGVLSIGISFYEYYGLNEGPTVFLSRSVFLWPFCLPQDWRLFLR